MKAAKKQAGLCFEQNLTFYRSELNHVCQESFFNGQMCDYSLLIGLLISALQIDKKEQIPFRWTAIEAMEKRTFRYIRHIYSVETDFKTGSGGGGGLLRLWQSPLLFVFNFQILCSRVNKTHEHLVFAMCGYLHHPPQKNILTCQKDLEYIT